MLPAATPSYPIVAAVRTSNEQGPDVRRNIVQNGGFDGSLSPWTSGSTNTGNQFTIVDGVATAIVPSGDSITLSQEIPQPSVGNDAYFFSMDIRTTASTPPARAKRQTSTSPVSCQINLQNTLGDTFYSQILDVADGFTTMYGSGTIQHAGSSNLVINAQCSGTSDGDVFFDNIFFYVFQASSDSNPDCSSGNSILQNGDFDNSLPPWDVFQGSSTSASFSVSGGQANIQFTAGASPDDDEAQLKQPADIPNNTGYTITANLYITLTSQGSCLLEFRNEFESLYSTGQISTSQQLPISVDGTSDIASSVFAITLSCSGPGVNRVGINTVSLVLKSGQNCSP